MDRNADREREDPEPIEETTAILGIFPEDSNGTSLPDTIIELENLDQGRQFQVERGDEPGQLIATGLPPGHYRVVATPESDVLEPVSRELEIEVGYRSITMVLGRPDQPFYLADGMKVYFDPDDRAFLLLTYGDQAADISAKTAADRGLRFELLPSFLISANLDDNQERQQTPDIGLLRVLLPDDQSVDQSAELMNGLAKDLRDRGLSTELALVIRRGNRPLQGLTTELVIQFDAGVSEETVHAIAEESGLSVVRSIPYAGNAYVLAQAEPPSYGLLDTAGRLHERTDVVAAEPNLINQMEADRLVPNDPLWPRLDHLPLVHCDRAWRRLGNFRGNPALRGGDPAITIAIFDPSGVSPLQRDLLEQLSDGQQKLVTSFNFARMAPQLENELGGADLDAGVSLRDHGTECAGSATAAFNNRRGIAGVAPNCHLIGARLPSISKETRLADVFAWAAGLPIGHPPEAGFPAHLARPADIISNSWGYDGVPLSTLMRQTFDAVTNAGRGGLGCIVVFSVGNLGHVPFGPKRPYAAYSRTIAVGASTKGRPTSPVNSQYPDPDGNTTNIVMQAESRALYSPYGFEMDLVAPSHTTYAPGSGMMIDPVCSTAREGRGDVDGCSAESPCPDFTALFGGTSHAAPMVAGAAALILSVNIEFRWTQVRRILRRSAAKIDPNTANTIGAWLDFNGDGARDFSRWYGYGRLDVDAALGAAIALV